MPSFAELRAKAERAKDASVEKMHSTRDKYSSQSSKKLDWDPNHKRPPPSAPGSNHTRNSSSISVTKASHPPPPPPPQRGPPIVRRDIRPDDTPTHDPSPPPAPVPRASKKATGKDTEQIDWVNISPQDKRVFFGWMDEFFERRRKIKIPKRQSEPTIQVTDSRPVTPPRPPTIPTWSRPPQASVPVSNELVMSYPPPSDNGSCALDFGLYFSSSTHWDSPWYLTADIPPSLQVESPPTFTAAWESRGPTKTMFGGVLFADLSMCWYSVSFSTTSPKASPNDATAVNRSAKYLPQPAALDQATLVEAHETYGESIAAFAESFEGTGQYCARGECWDLASEALKYFDQYDYIPKPVPSISRTHGHLIFRGKASHGGAELAGRWRGGDTQVRRGDIVEWRTVRIAMPNGGYSTLGLPDHTAVIVSDAVPRRAVSDGDAVKPSELGSLEVIEQSLGSPPKRQTYDLGMFQEGEVWIYRPIGMETYVGAFLSAQCPDNVEATSV